MNKQLEIQRYLSVVKVATIKQIYDNVSFGYYHNGHKHLGEILSRMVKLKKIERIKKGVFKFKEKQQFIEDITIQPILF